MRKITFKYISCYSLSLLSCYLWYVSPYLNTSHVILYPGCPSVAQCNERVFKYISCYSLSVQQGLCDGFYANLNTSHVILYLAS